jgi:hypothetical protein
MISRNKLFYTLFAFMMVMASCSDVDELFVSSDDNAITFGTGTGQTRETVNVGTTDLAGIKSSGFGVCAYYTGTKTWEDRTVSSEPNFMNKVKVSYNNGNWYYSPIKYWPKNSQEKISYFAYAPYSASDYLTTSKGYPLIDYDIVDDQNDIKTMRMWDLVIARNVDVSGKPVSDSDKTIKFAFKHVTSKVDVNARLGSDLISKGAKVYVTGLYVFGLYGNAKYNVADDKWEQIEVADSIDFTKRTNIVISGYKANSQTEIHGFPVLDGTLSNIFTNGMSNMFVIPQTADLHFEFEYYIISDENKDSNGYYAKKTAMLNIVRNFAAGTSYQLNFSFDTNGVVEVKDGDDNGENADDPNEYGSANYPYYLWVTNSENNVEGDIWNGLKEKYTFKAVGDGTYKLSFEKLPYTFKIIVADVERPWSYHCLWGKTYTNNRVYSNGNILLDDVYNLDFSNNEVSHGVENLYIEDADIIRDIEMIFDPKANTLKVTGTTDGVLSYEKYYIYTGSGGLQESNRLDEDYYTAGLFVGTFSTLNSEFYIKGKYSGQYYGGAKNDAPALKFGELYNLTKNRGSSKVSKLTFENNATQWTNVTVYFKPEDQTIQILHGDQWGDKFLYLTPANLVGYAENETYRMTYQGNGVYTGVFDVSTLNASGFYVKSRTYNYNGFRLGGGDWGSDADYMENKETTSLVWYGKMFKINTSSIKSRKVKVTVTYKDTDKDEYKSPTITEASITTEAM